MFEGKEDIKHGRRGTQNASSIDGSAESIRLKQTLSSTVSIHRSVELFNLQYFGLTIHLFNRDTSALSVRS